MGPTWVLSAPDGPHVGPMNLAIRDVTATTDTEAVHASRQTEWDGHEHGFCGHKNCALASSALVFWITDLLTRVAYRITGPLSLINGLFAFNSVNDSSSLICSYFAAPRFQHTPSCSIHYYDHFTNPSPLIRKHNEVGVGDGSAKSFNPGNKIRITYSMKWLATRRRWYGISTD